MADECQGKGGKNISTKVLNSTKKAELKRTLLWISGGADGTRTRGLRRDRPAL